MHLTFNNDIVAFIICGILVWQKIVNSQKSNHYRNGIMDICQEVAKNRTQNHSTQKVLSQAWPSMTERYLVWIGSQYFQGQKNVQGKWQSFDIFKVCGWEFSYLSVGPIIDTAGPT